MRRKWYAVLLCLVLYSLYAVPCYAAEYTLTEEDFLAPEGYFENPQANVNGWLSYLPDDEMDFDTYQEIMALMYPQLSEDYEEEEEEEEYDDVEAEDYDIATGSNARYASPSNAERTKTAGTARTAREASITVNAPVLYSSYTPYDSSISSTVITYMSDVVPKLGNVHYVLFRNGQYGYRLVYAKEMELDGSTFSAGDAQYVAYDSRYYSWTSGSEGSFTLSAGNYIVYSDLGDYPMLHSDSVYSGLLILFAGVFLLFTIYRSLFNAGRVAI